MANNYIPGFTPSLYGMPVKRMALGGRMEGARTFQERDDTNNFEAVGNPLGNLQNTLSNIDANSVLANYNNSVGSTAADTYQSQPTPQPVQTVAYNEPVATYSFPSSQPTTQPTTAVPYTEYAAPVSTTTSYQSQPTPQATTAVPYTDDSSAIPPLVISPEEQARMEAMFAQQRAQYAALNDPNYIANQQAKEDWLKQQASQGTYYTPAYNPLDFSANSGGILNLFGPPALQPAFDPSNPTANMQQVYYFDNGVRGSVPDPVTGKMVERNAHPLTFEAGQTYKMLDAKGNVVGTASTPAEMQNLVKLSEQLPVYTMQLEGNPYGNTLPSGGWLPNKTNAGSLESMLLNMAALALPAVGGAALGPVLAGGLGVSAPVATGLGTALGTAASGALAGKSIEDILLQAAISGIASGGLAALTAPGAPSAFDQAFSPEYAAWLAGGSGAAPAFSGAVGGFGGSNAPNIGDLQAQAIDLADFLSGLGVNPGLASQIASAPISSLGGVGGGVMSSAIPGSDAVNNLIQVIGSKAASNIPTSFLSSALGAASGALSGTNYGDQVWNRPAAQEAEVKEPGSNEYDPANKEIVVKSGKYKVDFDPKSILNNFLNADYTGTPDYEGLKDLIDRYNNMYEIEEPYADEDIVVKGAKKNPTVVPDRAKLPDLFPPLNSVDIPTDLVKEWPEIPTEEKPPIVVKGEPPKPYAEDLLPVFFPPINSVNVPPADTFQPSDSNKSILDEIKKYADLARLAATGLAPLFGGGGGGSGGSSAYSGMRGPLNPIFSAKLPKPNMQMAMPRALNFDAYRYGYGPEQSFFTNVPQGALNTSTAYTGYGTSPRYNATEQYASDFAALVEKMKKQREQDELEAAAAALGLTGYAEGGYAVGGPGDGRDDKIPAMLSDGEYVMDAETVALLGNGSPKAGADMLDKFRVNIRKHKGRDLAKGKFSANAKKPEQYLKGRK